MNRIDEIKIKIGMGVVAEINPSYPTYLDVVFLVGQLEKCKAALEFYENSKRLMMTVRDTNDHLIKETHIADNGDVARATLKDVFGE